MGCDKQAKFCLKLKFHDPEQDADAAAFINLNVCAEHRAPDDIVASNVQANWSVICNAFHSQHYVLPKFENTSWEWVPIAEMETHYKESVKHITRHWNN